MDKTLHFVEMMKEPCIVPEWVDRAVLIPDDIEDHPDNMRHYLKRIPEYGDRWLRVVVDTRAGANKGITVFFDRRSRNRK